MEAFDICSTPERTILDFADYALAGQFRLGRYSYNHAHNKLATHRHEGMMEICYCDKGLQVYEVKGQSYQIKGGDVFVTFPGEPHSTGNFPEEKGVLYWLIVKLPFDENLLPYDKEDQLLFTSQLLQLPARHFKGDPSMKKTLNDIFSLYESPKEPLNRLMIVNLISSFLLQVIRLAKETAIPAKTDSERIIDLKNYIAEHICEELSIEELARKMNLSDSHFKSWFKKEAGMPPLDYILRMRIEEGKKLMASHPGETIASIAYQLNFSSSQYFATVFKKYAGISPAAFRQGVVSV